MLNVNNENPDYGEGFFLKIPPEIQTKAWQEGQKQSNAIATYNAYLNAVAAETFLPWLTDWIADLGLPNPTIWPAPENLATLWEIVNGSAIEFGDTRLILIPIDSTEIEELRVPQEWVDIPSWIGDYYLLLPVNLDGDEEDCWLSISGFTTHRQLKSFAIYNAEDRTYSLPLEALTKDLATMELTFGLSLQAEIPEIPKVPSAQVSKLLSLFADPNLYSPRLQIDIPFVQWAALIQNESDRTQLYQQRKGHDIDVAAVPIVTTSTPVPADKTVINLRQWFQNWLQETNNGVQEVWQSLESLLGRPEIVRGRDEPELKSSGVREKFQESSDEAIAPFKGKTQKPSDEAIAPVIRLLAPTQTSETRRQAAGVLGEIGRGNPTAIQALTELAQNAPDEETRLQASLSLGKLDPGNPIAALRKARLIDLGIHLKGHKIGLIIALMPKDDDKIKIFLQVQPLGELKRLPPHLKLRVLSKLGEPMRGLEVESGGDDGRRTQNRTTEDQVLALQFSPPPGTVFQVEISLEDFSITEKFVA